MRKLLATLYFTVVLCGIAAAYSFNYTYPVNNETFLENWFTQYRAGVGYATGQGTGCAVTQITTRTTGVTCNGPTGAITMVSAAGSATAATFIVTDSSVETGDTIVYAEKSGTNLYEFFTTAVTAGTFSVTFLTTGGTATDAPVVNFAILKGSAN
jgi:hypothetical protein